MAMNFLKILSSGVDNSNVNGRGSSSSSSSSSRPSRFVPRAAASEAGRQISLMLSAMETRALMEDRRTGMEQVVEIVKQCTDAVRREIDTHTHRKVTDICIYVEQSSDSQILIHICSHH